MLKQICSLLVVAPNGASRRSYIRTNIDINTAVAMAAELWVHTKMLRPNMAASVPVDETNVEVSTAGEMVVVA